MPRDLHDLILAFAAHGDTGDGGVRRLTASSEDKAARDLLAVHMQQRGLALSVDAIGNMFGLAALLPSSREAVIVGSHLDSQPTGGRYDGTYGILAGLLAAEAVMTRAAAAPSAVRRNLVLANWTNEEGARYQPSLTGSSVYAGTLACDTALALADGEDVTLGCALEAIGYRGAAGECFDPVRYVELHIEQGAHLEETGAEIGIVTGAWAARKLSLLFRGEPSHTGPTPMARRRDALRAAARAIDILHDEVEASGSGAHGSAARIVVFPNSPNVVPSRVQVWFEIRHEDEAIGLAVGDRFLAQATASAQALGVYVDIAADERRGATRLDAEGAALARTAAQGLGFATLMMKTVAGHDAFALQRRVPSSLIFVPSRDGLSHTPMEFTDEAALEKGLSVLIETLWRMVTA
jgi:N-carbamoyl-L-amino-acid hydrolase